MWPGSIPDVVIGNLKISLDQLVVQSFYGLTLNKLQHNCSQWFLVQKNVLYSILKVLGNPWEEVQKFRKTLF